MVVEVHTPINLSVISGSHRTVKVPWTKEQLKEAFKRNDVNGDGKLSREEIEKAFKDLGSNFCWYRARKALSKADVDKNGYVNITDKELENLIDYAFGRGYVAPN